MTSRIVLGPFNRVEGDLEVTLDVNEGRVAAAYVNSTLFRGFEQILVGKHPLDALVITPRVCGICSVSQSVASARALANLMQVEMPPNGELATNLLHANENVADHFTHFYMFFMPDFARDFYANRPWFSEVHKRFKAVQGDAAQQVLSARAGFLQIMGFLGGKWPHTLSIQPGGSSRGVDTAEKLRLHALLMQFRHFLEQSLFGDTLESVCAISSEADLSQWRDRNAAKGSDFSTFLNVADDLKLHQVGRAYDRFMSYGNYAVNGVKLFKPGVWYGTPYDLDASGITEDVSHSWMVGDSAKHPLEGVTIPDINKAGAYSWCKAPRLAGEPVETGALARQLIDGHPLICDLVSRDGGNVRSRVIARLLEIALVQIAMERWVKALTPKALFCEQGQVPQDGIGYGLVEAARGSLGHWLEVSKGKLVRYQIVAPTTWNFSPRDIQGIPGALEKALEGASTEGDAVVVQHIVRSFDPCMVCTVH